MQNEREAGVKKQSAVDFLSGNLRWLLAVAANSLAIKVSASLCNSLK